MTDASPLMALRKALSRVAAPGAKTNIVAAGAVSAMSVDEDGLARFTLDVGDLPRDAAQALLQTVEAAAAAVPGVERVAAIATSHRAAGPPKAVRDGHANPLGVGDRKPARDGLAQVRNVIAVASGKGGVGKSTVAANLALAFARRGLATGLLDADIYGPSVPTLFGLQASPTVKDGVIDTLTAHGLRLMSIGFVVAPEKALAWRGPMVMGALRQLMNDVNWGALDVLIIDTPPGTGDVHLSLAQSGKLTGAVIVSTPQEMALADMRRGVALFRKVDVPVIGVIENMAWVETPQCERLDIFGEGGARRAAAALGAPFLGALPLFPDLRAACDAGAPLSAEAPASKAFDAIAGTIVAQLQ